MLGAFSAVAADTLTPLRPTGCYNAWLSAHGSMSTMKKRELEQGIHTDLKGHLTYSDYLCLDELLNAQQPLSDPPHHDEMMFIIEHQTAELWFKLILHELRAAIEHVRQDRLPPCRKILGRVKQIQRQLFNQWAVLETLTPSEYVQFRGVLGHASGFQSPQFRTMEFLLGNKNKDLLRLFDYDPLVRDRLAEVLRAPSLYDEFLRHLHRLGHAVPNELVNRDWSEPYETHPDVVTVFREIYEDTRSHWAAYEMCEKLLDVEENFQLWRFRHMKTVERIIGFKSGTGGSSGVQFLKRSLDVSFFPELIAVRTEIRE